MWWRHHDVTSQFTRTCQYLTFYQGSTLSHNCLRRYTISKDAPLMPHHVTSSDVNNFKLHTYDGCLTIIMCVNFEVITKNFTTHIFKKSILMSFQPVARGRYYTLWRHWYFLELPTIGLQLSTHLFVRVFIFSAWALLPEHVLFIPRLLLKAYRQGHGGSWTRSLS